MGWIEASYVNSDGKVSFRSEDVLYFSQSYNDQGTCVILGRNGHQQQINIQTDYNEFKEKMDEVKQFQKDWARAMIQSEPVIVPLREESQFANVPFMSGSIEEKEAQAAFFSKKEPRPFKKEELSSGNYIRFKEIFDFGEYGKRSKETNGWIKTFTQFPDGKINVDVRCDDNWGGARATIIDIEDIIELLPDKEQPE